MVFERKKGKRMKSSIVFTPGSFPTVTYVSRQEKDLERKVSEANNNLGKLVTVTGMTKLGKTVLVDKVFPNSDSTIWIDGGSVDSEDSFWEIIIEKLDVFTIHEDSSSDVLDGQVGINGVFKANVSGQHSISTNNSRVISNKTKALEVLGSNEIVLIIDDFHYIDKLVQKKIIRALKSPIMRGLPVVLIAIPNRKYDVVEVEREMTGRVSNIEMPIWDIDDLKSIGSSGFSALNVSIADSLLEKLAIEAYGSPFLMQEFCRKICEKEGIVETLVNPIELSEDYYLDDIFASTADSSGRSMFEKLRRGPRARKDRKQRLLVTGETVDIYELVMMAFMNMKPGVDSVSYETLRTSIRDLLDEDLPQRNEISRVLDQIASISYTDSSSTPVIDWQKDNNVITVTDPFFAFYLKWSDKKADKYE